MKKKKVAKKSAPTKTKTVKKISRGLKVKPKKEWEEEKKGWLAEEEELKKDELIDEEEVGGNKLPNEKEQDLEEDWIENDSSENEGDESPKYIDEDFLTDEDKDNY